MCILHTNWFLLSLWWLLLVLVVVCWLVVIVLLAQALQDTHADAPAMRSGSGPDDGVGWNTWTIQEQKQRLGILRNNQAGSKHGLRRNGRKPRPDSDTVVSDSDFGLIPVCRYVDDASRIDAYLASQELRQLIHAHWLH